VTDFGAGEVAVAIILQPDGKPIVVGTQTRNRNRSDLALARYELDGTLDDSFGTGGRVVTDTGATQERASGAALQPDRRLLVAAARGPIGAGTDFAVTRYQTDGRVNRTYGASGTGTALVDFGGRKDAAAAILAVGDGAIVVGESRVQSGASDFALTRLDGNGAPDPAFDGDGRVLTDLGGSDVPLAAALQPDGKIVVGGYTGRRARASDLQIALARYLPDGSLDSSFGGDGRVVTDLPKTVEAGGGVAIQANGKIVVSGGPAKDLTVLRYLPNGRRDLKFGKKGIASADTGTRELAGDVRVQRNGKLVVFGNTLRPAGPGDFAIARFLPNGALDRSWGQRGTRTVNLGPIDDAQAVVIQEDGRIVVAGSTRTTQADANFVVVRFLAGACAVPALRGRTLAAARRLLETAGCRLGPVTREFSRSVTKGRVASQTPRRGGRLEDYGPVSVVLSRGRPS
jgi:uncharacterized delta-60 repeat protein